MENAKAMGWVFKIVIPDSATFFWCLITGIPCYATETFMYIHYSVLLISIHAATCSYLHHNSNMRWIDIPIFGHLFLPSLISGICITHCPGTFTISVLVLQACSIFVHLFDGLRYFSLPLHRSFDVLGVFMLQLAFMLCSLIFIQGFISFLSSGIYDGLLFFMQTSFFGLTQKWFLIFFARNNSRL